MRNKFESGYRVTLALLGAVLLWSVWASAQTNGPGIVPAKLPPRPPLDEVWMTFGLNRVELLQADLFGQPLWQYFASAIYILLAFYCSKLLDFLLCDQFKKWAVRTETKLDELLLELLHGPIKIIAFVLLLHVGLRAFSWPRWVEEFLAKGLHLIVAVALTYMAVRAIDLLVNFWREHASKEGDKSFDEMLFPVIRKSLKVFVVVVSTLVTSQNLGLNITGVLASLSIGGLALGLAAQDTLSNLFGAAAIFLDKPFRIGDRIRLDTIDGEVESIGLRSTRVRNLDGFLVTIPNKTMGNATITNVARRPSIKTEMNFGLPYDTPSQKVRRTLAVLEEIYRSHPKTCDLIISFNKFTDSALNIAVTHWWDSTDQREYLAAMQELNLTIKERFDAEGIQFAFPTTTLHMKQGSEWRMAGVPA